MQQGRVGSRFLMSNLRNCGKVGRCNKTIDTIITSQSLSKLLTSSVAWERSLIRMVGKHTEAFQCTILVSIYPGPTFS